MVVYGQWFIRLIHWMDLMQSLKKHHWYINQLVFLLLMHCPHPHFHHPRLYFQHHHFPCRLHHVLLVQQHVFSKNNNEPKDTPHDNQQHCIQVSLYWQINAPTANRFILWQHGTKWNTKKIKTNIYVVRFLNYELLLIVVVVVVVVVGKVTDKSLSVLNYIYIYLHLYLVYR